MGKIAFFEDKNFEGRRYECSSDCPNLRSVFGGNNSIKVERGCFNSIKVETGCWVLYEHPNYTGSQYVMSPGKYPDPHQWMGFSVSILSCRSIKNVYGNSWKISIYEKKDFEGLAAECAEDCESVYEAFKFQEAHSSVVTDGAWVLYEQPDYRGRQYFLERGEYRSYTDWGATSPAVGSFRMITEF